MWEFQIKDCPIGTDDKRVLSSDYTLAFTSSLVNQMQCCTYSVPEAWAKADPVGWGPECFVHLFAQSTVDAFALWPSAPLLGAFIQTRCI